MDKYSNVGVVLVLVLKHLKIKRPPPSPPHSNAIDSNQVEVKYTPDQIRARLIKCGPVLRHPVAMYRGTVIKNHNIKYNDNYRIAFNTDLFHQFDTVTDMVMLKHYLLAYRWHERNASRVQEALDCRESMESLRQFINGNCATNLSPVFGEVRTEKYSWIP